MKKLVLIFTLIIVSASAFSQKNPFEKFMDMKGVTSVYISKNMLSLMPKNAKMDYGGVNVGDFVDKLSSIIILTSENQEIGQEMISVANKHLAKSKYELLMKVRSDDSQMVDFFMKGKPENIQELIMVVQDNDGDNVVMQFLGNFTLEDIQKMTGGFSD